MNSKFLGGVLLVIGTTIGAGMLALPVATAELGFFGSILMLTGCWITMTACAYLFLEVNLWLPANTNLISMAGLTLGRAGQAVAWVAYLLLLYSILSAYVAGGGDLFHYLLVRAGLPISQAVASLLFTMILGAVVYGGVRAVDYVNRGLMFGKMGAYFLLVLFILPFVSGVNLSAGEFKYITSPSGISVTVVSFGCLMIIPTLRNYFGEDVKSLRRAIFIGTLIPLLCYIAWDMVIMGVVPLEGTPGLKAIMHSSNSNSDVVQALSTILNKSTITSLAQFFTSICMATSFLSISLCLSDFLSDGLRVEKQGMGKVMIFAITFMPPIVISVFYPDAFLRGLKYAGISCLILMILMPALMVWRGRYHQDLAQNEYKVKGGKFLLATLMVFATLLIGFGLKASV